MLLMRRRKVRLGDTPGPTQQQQQDLDRTLAIAKLVGARAAHLLPMWSRLDFAGASLSKRPAAGRVKPPGHVWTWVIRVWQCEQFFRGFRPQEKPTVGVCHGGPGIGICGVDALALAALGHN